MTNNVEISFDPQFNPQIKYTPLRSDIPRPDRIPPEITKVIEREGQSDVTILKNTFKEGIQKALPTEGLPIEVQKIHELVIDVLIQTPEEGNISTILKAVKKFDDFFNNAKEMDEKSPTDKSKRVFVQLMEQIVVLRESIDSIVIPEGEDSPETKQLMNLKNQLNDQLNKLWSQKIKLPPDIVSQTAADIGKAYTGTIQAAVELLTQGKVLTPKGGSTSDVYLSPQEKLVSKVPGVRAERDEQDIQQLTHIMMPAAVLPAFKFRNLRPERQGFSMGSTSVQGFSSNDGAIYSTVIQNKILKTMTNPHSKSIATQLLAQEKNFKEFEPSSYEYFKNGAWHTVNFKELRDLYIKNELKGIPIKKLLVSDNEPFESYCGTNPKFHNALVYNIQENEAAMNRLNAERLVKQFSDTTFLFKKGEGGWEKISFEELKNLYDVQKLYDNNLLGEVEIKAYTRGTGMPFEQYCLENKDFFTALNFDSTQKESKPSHFSLTPDFRNADERVNYGECEGTRWMYQNAAGGWESVSFKELQVLYMEDKIGYRTSVKKEGKVKSIKDVPEAELQKDIWEYQRPDKTWVTLTQDVLKSADRNSLSVRQISSSVALIAWSKPSLERALDIKWKLMTPEVYSELGGLLKPIQNVVAKPFVEMRLFDEISKNKRYRDFLFKFLSPRSEAAMLLTGRQQFLDLHQVNFGVTAGITEEEFTDMLAIFPNLEVTREDIVKQQQELSKCKFSYKDNSGKEQKNVSLEKLQEDFQEGKINTSTDVTQHLPDGKSNKPSPILGNTTLTTAVLCQKFINLTPTELIFFDTDLVLGESNQVQLMKTTYADGPRLGHLLPIRSNYLAIEASDKPLQSETINLILNGAKERRDQMVNWIENKDASIRKFLPKNGQVVDDFLANVLSDKRYSLSFWRNDPKYNYDDISHAKVRGIFAADISKVTPTTENFWKALEIDLKKYTLTAQDSKKDPEDIWSTLAKRYKVEVKELKSLNPGLAILSAGTQLNVPSPYSAPLDGTSSESEKQRVRIAQEIFPRLTVPQKNALLEREDGLIKYLTTYAELSQPIFDPLAFSEADIKKQIASVLNLQEFVKIAPVTTVEREELDKQITALNDQLRALDPVGDVGCKDKFFKISEEIKKIYESIKLKCVPTYTNTLKVMYPLFADAQFLLEAFASSKEEARKAIGRFDTPLETLIDLAKERGPDDVYHKAALKLKERIEADQAPSRFFNIPYPTISSTTARAAFLRRFNRTPP